MAKRTLPLRQFVVTVRLRQPIKVKGTAVDLTERTFTVHAKTARGATAAIRNASAISGRVTSVEAV